MRWRAWIIYTLASSLLAAGVMMSLQTEQPEWFARSGCLVVILGIGLTSQQIFRHLEQLRSRRGDVVKHRYSDQHDTNPSNHDWANDPQLRRWLHEDEEQSWANERHGLILLVLGTLVWGFGDLLMLGLLVS